MAAHLTRLAEQHLVALARAGDRAAASALLHSLDALLRRAAFPYRDAGHGLGISFDDFLQEARLEVLAAVQDYDPTRPALFRSYAMTRVRHRLFHIRRDGRTAAAREAGVADASAPAHSTAADDALVGAQLDAAVARALVAALAGVAARERRILRARLVSLHTGHEAATLRAVGAECGVSHEHVRKVEAGALAGMRARLGAVGC
jgi:RNA polymerase sigma factor (sigma-70 family)